MDGFVDSHTLFIVLAKDKTTTECRLHIDIKASKKRYGHRDLQKIEWISESSNKADVLTKKMVSQKMATCKLMTETS